MPQLPILVVNGIRDHRCNLRHAQESRASGRDIQKPVHANKGLA